MYSYDIFYNWIIIVLLAIILSIFKYIDGHAPVGLTILYIIYLITLIIITYLYNKKSK